MNTENCELLAPAGDMNSLKAAVVNGANAIYVGLKEFSARAKAANFSLEELSSAIEYAHLFGVKIYVAVNTLIKDEEMSSAISLINGAQQLGVDAIILQDLGLLKQIREQVKIPLHASTQVGVHNVYGAEIAKKLGFDRIILSREATLDDIRQIHKNVDIEIEAFVQGALCVAFSGDCLFSSLVSGYSGNRGKCMQLCRKKYRLQIEGLDKQGYYLSAKDLCRLSHLRELADSGVTSFKIEGRMRRHEYVGETVSVYRKALDCPPSDYAELIKRLKSIYNRGNYCTGYISDATENVIYPLVQGHMGIKIGTVERVAGKTAYLSSNKTLRVGDGLKFVGQGGESGGSLISTPEKITFSGNVRASDEVYLTTDSAQIEEINRRRKQIKLSLNAVLKAGEPATVTIKTDGAEVRHVSQYCVQKAQSAPLEYESVKQLLSKGIPPEFAIDTLDVEMDDNIFMTIGQLKNLRRDSINQVKELILQRYKTPKNSRNDSIMSDIIRQNTSFSYKKLLRFDDTSYITQYNSNPFIDAFIYFPKDFYAYDDIVKAIESSNKPIFLETPVMARSRDLDVLKRFADCDAIKNIVAQNLYACELFASKNVLLGENMNLINHTFTYDKIASLEADTVNPNDYVIAFSHIPIMTFAHCPKKNAMGKCSPNCRGFVGKLTDERNNSFDIKHFKVSNCYARLMNSRPLFIYDVLKKKRHERVIFDFCGYPLDFAVNILRQIESSSDITFEHTHFNYNKVLY